MTAASLHIVFAEPYNDSALAKARAVGRVTVLERMDDVALARALRDADALLIRTAARATRESIDGAPRLRVIGRAGVGLDNVDLDAARRRGIVVVHTPAAATDAVADLTVGLMISLIRGITQGDRLVRAGRFEDGRANCLGVELSGLTLGILGLGRIGKAVARRCRNGFGMSILYRDIVEMTKLDFEAAAVEFGDLCARSDVVSLHVPLTNLTRRMIDDRALSGFKPGGYLINTARGAVVDHEALATALADGRLAGAALDVVEPEPLPPYHSLFSLPNVLITPHIGARTRGGLERMNDVIDDVIGVLRGELPRNPAP